MAGDSKIHEEDSWHLLSHLSAVVNVFLPISCKHPSIQDAKDYLRHCTAAGFSATTLRLKRHTLLPFISFMAGRPFATGLEAYALEIRARVKSPTVASYSRSVNAFLAWLRREGRIEDLDRLIVRRTQTLPKGRSLHEIMAAIESAHIAARPLALFLFDSGCRLAEALGMQGEHLDRDGGRATVCGKGGLIRQIAFGAEVGRILPTCGRIFPHDRRTYQEWLRTAGISAHVLRHSFARHFLSSGGGIHELQQILGHSTPTMSLHYARLYAGEALERQRDLSPVDRHARSLNPNTVYR